MRQWFYDAWLGLLHKYGALTDWFLAAGNQEHVLKQHFVHQTSEARANNHSPTCLNAMFMSLLSSMSLNIPSSFEVKPPPHSCFSFDSMLFSASTLADFPTSSRFARSCYFRDPQHISIRQTLILCIWKVHEINIQNENCICLLV